MFCQQVLVLAKLMLTRFLLVLLLITFANRLDTDQAQKTSDLIWIQSVCHSDHIPKIIFRKVDFEKNQQSTKKHEKFPRGQRVKPFMPSTSAVSACNHKMHV